MADLNNITMTGRLTRDPETRHTQSGLAVCKFQLASNGFKDGDTCFVRCTAFGKRAESLHKHFSKGDRIGITGRLKLDQWEDKNTGQKREAHGIDVNDWAFVDSAKSKGGKSGDGDYNGPGDWDAPATKGRDNFDNAPF